MSQFYNLNIKDITKETDNAVVISLDVPESLKDVFTYKAGQYITFKTQINGEEIRRDYSICSSINSNELKVAVKAVENGLFSTFANTKLNTGDSIEVSSPNGRFVFEPKKEDARAIAAFAAGSGITPILGIAKTLLQEEPYSNFVLVYGNKTIKDTMFHDELTELQNAFPNRFNMQLVFSQSDEEGGLFGRIDKGVVNFTLKNKFNHLNPSQFYLCGPEEMIHIVKDALIENGVSEDNVFYELFTTSAKSSEEIQQTSDGTSRITVLVDDEETSFTMSQDKSILEAALAEDIDAPYSCQGGICSSCIAKLTEGSATMRQNNILTDGELAEGLVLTCQAYPTTPTVVVDYDDV